MKTFDFYLENDIKFLQLTKHLTITGVTTPVSAFLPKSARKTVIRKPDDEYAFLHEAAIGSFQGKLFAAWYCCPKTELAEESAILFSVSPDGGKTWGEEKIVVTDKEGKILYCPPVFWERDGALYMLVNEMISPDHMHALDTFRYDEEAGNFTLVSTMPLPFKLNTSPERLDNGKWFFPGRIAELDQFPVTPAGAIVDGDSWRIVKMQENGELPDGSSLVHPECSAMVKGAEIFVFCRNDRRQVPLAYYSSDFGESFLGPYSTDLPFVCSKIYSGKLSDGRYYVVGNIPPKEDTGWGTNRSKLALYISKKDEWTFEKEYILFDGVEESEPDAHAWHYPACTEHGGELHIIFSVNYGHQRESRRGATLLSIPVADL